MTEQDYITYFETLATNHAALQHTPEAPHFQYVRDATYTDLPGLMRTKIRPPLLLLYEYDDTVLSENDNCRCQIAGGFSVLCPAERGHAADIIAATDIARQIALDIIARMRLDIKGPTGSLWLRKAIFTPNFEGEPVQIGSAAGRTYSFVLTAPVSLNVDTARWHDL